MSYRMNMSRASKIVLIGERLLYRSLSGANKALPVLSSSLRNAGFEHVVQLDLERPDLSFSDVLEEARDADLIGFAGCLTTQWPEIDTHARRLRGQRLELGREDVPIIVGGYAAKGVEDVARLTPWIDAYFSGDGEEGIVAIAQSVARQSFREEARAIPGLCFWEKHGSFHESVAPRVRSLDPYDQNFGFTHVPSSHDMEIFKGPDGRQLKTAQLYTQRGCPWVCEYCNKSLESNLVARLGHDVLRDQLRQLRAEGYEAVYLDVDTFTVSPSLARQEARILFEEGFVWGSNTRIDRIDRATMDDLRANGCVYMFYGVEHTLPEVLLAVRKFNGSIERQQAHCRAYPDLVQRVFSEMRASGVPSSYFVILGLPKACLDLDGRTIVDYKPASFEDDWAAIEFGLTRCQPDFLNLNVLRFMPGSSAADRPDHPAYSPVRPSGSHPITAGYFLPRVARSVGYTLPDTHGAFRLCESIGPSQPASTAVDAQRIYDTFCRMTNLINQRIDAGYPPVSLFIDREILQNKLATRDEKGRYFLASFAAFETL
jgi:anaerobic magnesium-protoporphyrin IX monomethyl ester cyclase